MNTECFRVENKPGFLVRTFHTGSSFHFQCALSICFASLDLSHTICISTDFDYIDPNAQTRIGFPLCSPDSAECVQEIPLPQVGTGVRERKYCTYTVRMCPEVCSCHSKWYGMPATGDNKLIKSSIFCVMS